ncbi:MAG: ATP-binding protein [Calditrichia bacterium]
MQPFGLLRRFGILFFLLAASQTLFSQSYLIHNYTYRNGLPSSEVYDVAQDTNGTMWFGTRNGLISYDGHSWSKEYYDTMGVYRSCYMLEVDPTGKLWVTGYAGPLGGRLFYRDGNKWHEVVTPTKFIPLTGSNGELHDIHFTSIDGFVSPWLAINGRGLTYLNQQNEWQALTTIDGLADNTIYSLQSDNHILFVATPGGLQKFTYNRATSAFDMELIIDEAVWKLAAEYHERGRESSGLKRLWIVGSNGISVLEDGELRKIRGPVQDVQYQTLELQPDYLGGCFVGSQTNLDYVTLDGTVQAVGKRNGFLADNITNMMLDREGLIWFCSYRGVSKLVSRRFETYNRDEGLLASEITAVQQFDNGDMLFGHNWGFTLGHGENAKQINLQNVLHANIGPVRIMQMAKDSDNQVWASAAFGGVLRVSSSGEYQYYPSPPSEETGNSHVAIGIAFDRQDRLLVGMSNGIFELKEGAYIPVYEKELKHIGFRSLYKDRSENLLFCTINNGLFRQMGDSLINYRYAGEGLGNEVVCAFELNNGELWVGTWAGLSKAENGELTRPEGFPDMTSPVYFIVEDDADCIWLGSDNGVWRWDGANLKNFGLGQGLVGLETNRGAGFIDREGSLWFGTNNGVSRFQPGYDFQTKAKPVLSIKHLNSDNDIYSLDRPVELNYLHPRLSIAVLANTFVDERNVKFRYRLDGFDTDWQMLEGRPENQEFRYNYLPSGDYRFSVQIENANGLRSDIVSSSRITINRPFWEEWWFLSSLLLLTIMLIIGALNYRSQRLYAGQLEKEIHDRTTQLRSSEQRYKQLFDESKDVVFISTPNGRFLDMNAAGLVLFGVPSLSAIQELDIASHFYLNSEDRKQYIRRIKQHGYLQDYEIKMTNYQGKHLTILETVTAVKDMSGSVQYRGIMRDVTRQRTMEKQLVLAEKMEALGLMASGIAHEFNNQLSGILGYADLLKLGFPKNSEEFNYAKTLEESARNAAELTEQLLGFAQKGNYRIEPLDLNKTIVETQKLFGRIFDRAIELKLDLDQAISTIEGDKAQIQRVIINLAINARDAMPNGGILTLATSIKRLTEEQAVELGTTCGDYCCLIVSDTGVGIDKRDQKQIFEPFFTTKGAGKGTGLGLAMVYATVKSHSGAISVESTLGRGTCFTIYFPLSGKKLIDHQSYSNTPEPGSETIMIVDDEKHIRSLLKHSLERYGYKTLLASDGIEAISVFKQHRTDIRLVILDMIMPKMGGSETIHKLNELNCTAPILIATGYPGSQKDVEDIVNYSTIKKPFKVSLLLRKVRAILDGDELAKSTDQLHS